MSINESALYTLDEKGRTALHQFCVTGDIVNAKKALEFNSKYLNTLANGNIGSPLADACTNGHIEIIKYLIQAKANIHLCARHDHSTALHKAAQSNSLDSVSLLLENKADVASKTAEDCTPLHYAIKRNSIQIVRLLTMYGSSVNVIDKNLSSPLHYAAQYADAEVTKFLIDMNANIEAIDKNGMTPLIKACFFGNTESSRILIENNANLYACDAKENTPLHWSCLRGKDEIVALLLSKYGDKLPEVAKQVNSKRNGTPLQLAAREGHTSTILLLIQNGFDVNGLDAFDNTAFHAGAIGKDGKINVELMVTLLENGANPDLVNGTGVTPVDKALSGRDFQFSSHFFCKIVASSLPPSIAHPILTKITAHPTFEVNTIVRTPDGEIFSSLTYSIKYKLFPVAYNLIDRGANCYSELENLPAIIFHAKDKSVINVFLDKLCASKTIKLSNCNLASVPDSLISKLQELDLDNKMPKKILDLSQNQLKTIPTTLAFLSCISTVKLEGNPLSLIPVTVRASWIKTQAYLKNISKRASAWAQSKLIFVGEEGMGKTTLLKCFKTKKGKVKCKENISTNGIEIHEGLSFQSKSENNVLFNAWDFGGQEIFYPTHQFFLTKHAVYVIVFNLANYQMERIEYWLWQIRVIAANSNSTPIFLVGTHMDSPKVCQEALAVIKKDLSKKFPNQRFHGMQGVHFVSCKTGQGIPELRECIVDVVKQEGFLPQVPAPWIRMADLVGDKQTVKDRPYVKWNVYQEWAISCEIATEEIETCTQFLKDSGTIVPLHDIEDPDNGLVVLNPHWLSQLMGNFITFKHSWIKEGALDESHLKQVLVDYPVEIHILLLNMLKKFNILFPVSTNSSVKFVIPSLLPESAEPLDVKLIFWYQEAVKCYGRFYTFLFLPLGLISRLIVRLLHIPNVSGKLYWRNGVIIEYKHQLALIQYLPKEYKLQILIKVPPETVGSDMFFSWIVEITDNLIDDSFLMQNAVQRSIPCTHCLQLQTEPFLFTFRECVQAIVNKRPTLFCNYIHSLSREVQVADLAPDIAFADIPVLKQKELTFVKVIAKSNSGLVWEGELSNFGRVAIKQINLDTVSSKAEDTYRSFQYEVNKISKLQHPNLVTLIGVSLYPKLQMILEFLDHGDLFHFLHPNFDKTLDILPKIEVDKFPWELRIKIALDIAYGMDFLQNREIPIIHRDLRTPNIFLMGTGTFIRAKVADFGLSRLVTSSVEGSLETWEWMAPETFYTSATAATSLTSSQTTYHLSADIYSYGIICWEIASRDYPFNEFRSDPIYFDKNGNFSALLIKHAIVQGLRPSIHLADHDTPAEFRNLIENCWNSNPNERWSFTEIINRLEDMRSRYTVAIPNSPIIDGFKKAKRNVVENFTVQEEPLEVTSFQQPINWNNAYVEDYKLFAKLQLEIPATVIKSFKDNIWIGCREGSIIICDKSLKKVEYRWKAHDTAITCLLFVNNVVWSTSVGGCIRIWDVNDYHEIHEHYPFRAQEYAIKQLMVVEYPPSSSLTHSSGKQVKQIWGASPNFSQLFVWDADTYEPLHYVPVPKSESITKLEIYYVPPPASIEAFMLAGDAKGEIHMIDYKSLQYFGCWPAHTGPISGIVSLINSKKIFSCSKNSNEIKGWTVTPETVEETHCQSAHSGCVSMLVKSDSRYTTIFSCSANSIVCWDTEKLKAQQELIEHKKPILSMHHHDRSLYSLSNDGIVLCWRRRDKFLSNVADEVSPVARENTNILRRSKLYQMITTHYRFKNYETPKEPASDNTFNDSPLSIVSPSPISKQSQPSALSKSSITAEQVRSRSSSDSSFEDIQELLQDVIDKIEISPTSIEKSNEEDLLSTMLDKMEENTTETVPVAQKAEESKSMEAAEDQRKLKRTSSLGTGLVWKSANTTWQGTKARATTKSTVAHKLGSSFAELPLSHKQRRPNL